MEYGELGKTGLTVSALGYGAWGIGGSGWIGAREDESRRALERAIELGVNFVDTARGYGESERIVGQVVRDHPADELYVATKVPPKNGRFQHRPDSTPKRRSPPSSVSRSTTISLRAR